MPDAVIPATFIVLLSEFYTVFTSPTLENFKVLVIGAIHAIGKHRVSDIIRASGSIAHKHYCTYYRFFSHAHWDLDAVGLVLFELVCRFINDKTIECVLDDTLARRTGKKVALATMHADPLLKQKGKPFCSYGHVFVVLAVHIKSLSIARVGWALPFMFRLFESSKMGGQKHSPHQKRKEFWRRKEGKQIRQRYRLTDRKVENNKIVECPDAQPDNGPLPDSLRPTKLQLAADMILKVATQYRNLKFRIIADHAYNGKCLFHNVLNQVGNVSFISRGNEDAALYKLPPKKTNKCGNKRGRPRVKGERLPTPKKWAEKHPEKFVDVTLDIYGHDVKVQVAHFDGMAYRTLPGRLIRYVIVKDPNGIYDSQYLMCTDTEMTAEQIVVAYSNRWPLELTFKETKQKLGLQDPQTKLPLSVRRTVPFSLLIYSLVVLWYLKDGYLLASKLSPIADPWYTKKPRPSFSDMLATLRRAGWRKIFVDPTWDNTLRSKILEDYITKIVVAA
jgi:hypothetical protein